MTILAVTRNEIADCYLYHKHSSLFDLLPSLFLSPPNPNTHTHTHTRTHTHTHKHIHKRTLKLGPKRISSNVRFFV